MIDKGLCEAILPGILFSVGLLTIAKYLAALLLHLSTCLKPRKNLIKRYGEDSWVVVTGASDGIGKAFCFDLAEEGFNVCLVARNKAKMDGVVKEMEENQKQKGKKMIKTRVVVFDFLMAGVAGALEEVAKQLPSENISILINNVGIHEFDEFHSQDEKAIKDTMLINCYSIVLLTRFLIPHMLKRSQNLFSAVINLCSIAGTRPMPYFATYSATRAFSDFFSGALAQEYAGKNIDIMALRPGIVDTSHSMQRRSEGIFQISAGDCSKGALKRLGNEKSTSGHWIHKIYVNVARLLPEFYIKRNAKRRVDYKRLLEKHIS